MKLVFGLGNPGPQYQHTRHNAGFDVLDNVAKLYGVEFKKHCLRKYAYATLESAVLVKPLTRMNASGDIIRFFRNKCDVKNIMVICDNMDLAVGGIRLRIGGESGGQKGLQSIQNALGRADFVRLFVGVGRPQAGVEVNTHVLSVESDPEKKTVYQQVLQDCAKAVKDFIDGVEFEKLQSCYNRKGLQ